MQQSERIDQVCLVIDNDIFDKAENISLVIQIAPISFLVELLKFVLKHFFKFKSICSLLKTK